MSTNILNQARAWLACALLSLFPSVALAQTGTFLFVGGGTTETCSDSLNGGGPNCIFGMSSPSPQQRIDTDAAARKFVQTSQQKLGVGTFLLAAGLLNQGARDQLTPLATAIQQTGTQFYVDEGWTIRNATINGTFTCSKYISDQVVPYLLPLKTAFPMTFVGLSYDEPRGADSTNMSLFANCWRNTIPALYPVFGQMKLFIDLMPTYADATALTIPTGDLEDKATADCQALYSVGPSDIQSAQLADYPKTFEYLQAYCKYAHAIVKAAQPDFLAFNYYPSQQNAWANSGYPGNTTADLRDFMLGENSKIVGAAARKYSTQTRPIRPVSYTQNFNEYNQVTQTNITPVADFHLMRWHAGIAYANGITEFANFPSHSRCADATHASGSPCAHLVAGFFDNTNSPDLRLFGTSTPGLNPYTMYADAMPGVVGALKRELTGYTFLDTVFPHQGVLAGTAPGHALGWLPTPNLVAGEYGSKTTTGQVIIIFANRNYSLTIPPQIASFNYWVRTVEKYDFWTGLWVKQNTTSTNSVTFSESAFPFSVIRITP